MRELRELIVTRHQGLVNYLVSEGHVSSDAEVVSHADVATVAGRHVWGVLPHSLSVWAESFTEVPLNLPLELRGVELTEEQVRQYAGRPVTYRVNFDPNSRPCNCGSGEPWTTCGSGEFCG